uniref:AF4/FMR2 family, member 2 n=1 Tax=Seriola dumerili TaxID=41447 RepID=A0A3B4UKJ7_SERDU
LSRDALKRREWERRNQEVQQDEDLFSTGFNLFGEPYKVRTNKGDALASRVQNTLGSYEEMKDLLTSHSNQSHLVGIPKGSSANNNLQTPTTSTTDRPAMESQLFNDTLRGGSRSSMDWSRGGHGQSTQGPGLVLGLGQNGQGQAAGAASGRGKISLLEEQQMQRHEELFNGGNFRSSTMDGGHFKSSANTENGGHFKSSPFENETGSHLSTSSSPLASTSVLTTPTPGLTTPTSGLTTPTFPPGSLSGKPVAVQQKPTAYVRPMDGQDQAPSDSPQLKPPLVATEGFNGSSQAYGGNSGNVKNKLPKLSLSHTGEVRQQPLSHSNSIYVIVISEMTHSWPPPLTAIHTPGKADQTKFPIPNKVSNHFLCPVLNTFNSASNPLTMSLNSANSFRITSLVTYAFFSVVIMFSRL